MTRDHLDNLGESPHLKVLNIYLLVAAYGSFCCHAQTP